MKIKDQKAFARRNLEEEIVQGLIIFTQEEVPEPLYFTLLLSLSSQMYGI
jgi:hypothetical protein